MKCTPSPLLPQTAGRSSLRSRADYRCGNPQLTSGLPRSLLRAPDFLVLLLVFFRIAARSRTFLICQHYELGNIVGRVGRVGDHDSLLSVLARDHPYRGDDYARDRKAAACVVSGRCDHGGRSRIFPLAKGQGADCEHEKYENGFNDLHVAPHNGSIPAGRIVPAPA